MKKEDSQNISDLTHDLNNSLMIISGYAQLCLMEELGNKKLEDNLKVIVEQARLAKERAEKAITLLKQKEEK